MLSGHPALQILRWPEFFGRGHIGSIIGVTQFFGTMAGAIGPVVAGLCSIKPAATSRPYGFCL